MKKKKKAKGTKGQHYQPQPPANALLASRRAVELFRKTAMLDDRLDHWGFPEGGTLGIDPKVRSGASACVVGDEVWVYGGLGAGRSNDFNILHLPTMRWRCLPAEEQRGMHPPARSGHSCTAIGHRFVIFGGEGEALVPDGGGGGDAHRPGHVVGKGAGRVAVHSHRNDMGDACVFDTLACTWRPVATDVGRRADGTHASQQNAPSARRGHSVTFVPGAVPPRECLWGERDWHDVPREHAAHLETGVDVHAAREERRAKHLAEFEAAERAAAAAAAAQGGGGLSEGAAAPKAHGAKDHRRASDAAELLPGSRAGGGSGSLWLFGGAGPDVQHATETTFDGLYVCNLHDFVWTKVLTSAVSFFY